MSSPSKRARWYAEKIWRLDDNVSVTEYYLAIATIIDSAVGEAVAEKQEQDAKILDDKAVEYEKRFNEPASVANSFSPMMLDTPAGYATYHAFKTLLPTLAAAIRNPKEENNDHL